MGQPKNARVHALENASERTARGLIKDPEIEVIVGGMPCYIHKLKRLVVPAWSEEPPDPLLVNASRGLLDHECGHAILTDHETVEEALERWTTEEPEAVDRKFHLLNAFEDSRMERALPLVFPGSALHLADKNRYLIKTLGTRTNPNEPTSDGGTIGFFGAFVQGIVVTTRQVATVEECDPEIQPALKALWPLIEQSFSIETTAGLVPLVDAIWDVIKPPEEPPPDQDQEGDSGGSSGGGGEQDNEDTPGDCQDKGSQSPQGAPNPNPQQDDEDQNEGAPNPNPQQDDEDQNEGDPPDDGAGSPDEGDVDDEDQRDGGPPPGGSDGTADSDGSGQPGAPGEGSGDVPFSPGGGEQSVPARPGEGPPAGPGQAPHAPHDAGDGEEVDWETPPGAGFGRSPEDLDLQASLAEGEWGEIPTDMEVIGNAYIGDRIPPYTVHPDSQRRDRVYRYDRQQREEARPFMQRARIAAGTAAQKLNNYLRAAVQASRQSLRIGGVEEGEWLDDSQTGMIAMSLNGPDVFETEMRRIEESTGVMVLVDCSGSMGRNLVQEYCDEHGQQGGSSFRRTRAWDDPSFEGDFDMARSTCGTCGKPTKAMVSTKSGYAQITAMALHSALRQVRVPHSVAGYTTIGGVVVHNPKRPEAPNYLTWSRVTEALAMHLFVEAPGIYDDGLAIPYINGYSTNLDGESVLWAAKYAAKHFGHLDRVIMIVIADGLPSGADDCAMNAPHLQQAVEQVCHAGIEVYGVGVGIGEHNYETFQKFYPDVPESRGRRAPSGSMYIPSGEGLTDDVLRKLTSLLTRGYGQTRKVKM